MMQKEVGGSLARAKNYNISDFGIDNRTPAQCHVPDS